MSKLICRTTETIVTEEADVVFKGTPVYVLGIADGKDDEVKLVCKTMAHVYCDNTGARANEGEYDGVHGDSCSGLLLDIAADKLVYEAFQQ